MTRRARLRVQTVGGAQVASLLEPAVAQGGVVLAVEVADLV